MASVSLQNCFVRHVAVPHSSGVRFNLELQIQLLNIKLVFVTGNLRESIINRLGDVVNDARQVI